MTNRDWCNVQVEHNLKRYRVVFSRSGKVLLVAVRLGSCGERLIEMDGVRGKKVIAAARDKMWGLVFNEKR